MSNISLSLPPDGNRGRQLNIRMHTDLCESLRHVMERSEEPGISPGIVTQAQRLQPLIDHLESGRLVPPAVFGVYYRMIFNLLDNTDNLKVDIDLLLSIPLTATTLRVIPFDATALGGKALLDLYRNTANNGEDYPIFPVEPANKAFQHNKQVVLDALQLMASIDRDLSDEFHHLIVEICLAVPANNSDYNFFGSFSTCQFWRSIVKNIEVSRSVPGMMFSLIHETTHMLLFGYTTEEPLVLNADDELHESPFREDLRPMEGIYHAAYVAARVCYCAQLALDSGALDQTMTDETAHVLKTTHDSYNQGIQTIRRHAQLSATGELLLDGAARAMKLIH